MTKDQPAPPELRCPRCDVPRETGFAVAPLGALARWQPAGWTAGEPQRGALGGLAGTDPHHILMLQGARCPQCGSVELFARSRMPF